MRIRRAAAVVLLATTAACGSAGGHQATHKKVPCALIENDESRYSRRAYREIMSAIHDMEDSCRDWGHGVQAWAEDNPQQPHGFEVLASCVGELPQ
jgi:hypothetical protein